MALTVIAVSPVALFSKLMQITLLTSSILVISLNGFVFDAEAQQGGAATGGDATAGGPNCNVANACTIMQAPKGGDATGGDAIGSAVTESPPPAESPPSSSSSNMNQVQQDWDEFNRVWGEQKDKEECDRIYAAVQAGELSADQMCV